MQNPLFPMFRVGLLLVGLLGMVSCATSSHTVEPTPAVADSVSLYASYQPAVDRILKAAREGTDAWKKMEELCDGIGHRITGSPQLKQAIQWAQDAMKADGHENVRADPVAARRWIRGEESITMLSPREEPLVMLGLGGSVATPKGGLEAAVEVVSDEAELQALGAQVSGKIVLFNNPMPAYDPETGAGYGKTVRFRVRGPRMASKLGAVGVLVRSVTAHSLRTPHTGGTWYGDSKQKIPAAAITTEDADLISRLRATGEEVRVRLVMNARDAGPIESANVIGELRGREKPEEVVVIGGHLDSWDVGQGAHDDATGVVMAMQAITILRRLGLRPRRTIRVVLWTNEEYGLAGGKSYAKTYADQLPNHVAAIESDSGGFAPRGFRVQMKDKKRQALAIQRMQAIADLLQASGATRVKEGYSGADIRPMMPANVPLMGLWVDGSTYFNYHHTPADTLDKVVPDELNRCVGSMAAAAYVLAEMPGRLDSLED